MDNAIEVQFKSGGTGRYIFAKDLKQWEKHFVDIWKKCGHKVKVVPIKQK